jgi:hypothetical protein
MTLSHLDVSLQVVRTSVEAGDTRHRGESAKTRRFEGCHTPGR